MPDSEAPKSLEDVISKSIDDAVAEVEDEDTPEEPEDAPGDDSADDDDPTPSEDTEGSEEAAEGSEEGDADSGDVPAVATADGGEEKPEKAEKAESEDKGDDFEKRFGVAPKTKGGKENRIPYRRVRKIVENAEAAVKQQAEEALSVYQKRVDQFNQFENLLTTRPQEFLQLLSTVPAYQGFFQSLQEALADRGLIDGGEEPEAAAVEPDDEMPGPNQTLEDGSQVYDLDGLKEVLAWQAKKVEERVTQQIAQRYEPLEQEWQEYHEKARLAQEIIPKVKQQAAEARTWPHFADNETEIVKTLQENKGMSLEAAYRHVVIPKLQANRDQTRQTVLKELKRAPRSTTAPTGSSKAVAPERTGPRDLTDVINEAVKSLEG